MTNTLFLVRLLIKINLQLHDQNKVFFGTPKLVLSVDLFLKHHLHSYDFCTGAKIKVRRSVFFGPQFLTAQNLGLQKKFGPKAQNLGRQKNLGRSPKMSPTNQKISSLFYDSVYTFIKYSLSAKLHYSSIHLTTKKMECKSVYN